MPKIQTTAALNLLADGTSKNSTQPKITTQKTATGLYLVSGVIGLASEGWAVTIKENWNGEKTISLDFESSENGLIVKTFERGTTTPKDIEGALTLRFDVEIDVPEFEEIPA